MSLQDGDTVPPKKGPAGQRWLWLLAEQCWLGRTEWFPLLLLLLVETGEKQLPTPPLPRACGVPVLGWPGADCGGGGAIEGGSGLVSRKMKPMLTVCQGRVHRAPTRGLSVRATGIRRTGRGGPELRLEA